MHWKRITHSRSDSPFYGTAARFARERKTIDRPHLKERTDKPKNNYIKKMIDKLISKNN